MRQTRSDIEAFISLPDSQKAKIISQIESQTPQQHLASSRSLNARELLQWRRFKSKMGRPKVGKGAKTISLTVEMGLLKRADAYARRHGLSRATLVARGLKAIIESAA
ncbi:MAG TPA: hypothetical protein VFC78_12115 [Tepidisphaeraceae bacterium]|nr:hypothetical protein [Tepidisphaeraceae bacterium]